MPAKLMVVLVSFCVGGLVRASAAEPPSIFNVTRGTGHPTLAEAIAAVKTEGEVIEVGPGVLPERGLMINGKTLTIRGAGPEQSLFLPGVEPGDAIIAIRNAARVTIEGFSFVGAVADSNPGVSTLDIAGLGARVTVRECVFEGGDSGGRVFGAVLVSGGGAGTDTRFERCVFANNTGATLGSAAVILADEPTLFINCLFTGNAGAAATVYTNGTARFVNCTFAVNGDAACVRAANDGSVRLDATVVDAATGAPAWDPAAAVSMGRCMWPGAPAVALDGHPTLNIDADPVFVDPDALDFRLLPGTPGIDAADSALYLAEGGGFFDLVGRDRTVQDSGVVDSGVGPFPFVDLGAIEFQGRSGGGSDCVPDTNKDGVVDFGDIALFVSLFMADCDG